MNRTPRTSGNAGMGGGGEALKVVGWREARDEEKSGYSEQDNHRRAENNKKIAPIAHD